MHCCITEMNEKEVVNLRDGCRLGYVTDVEVDTCTGHIVAIVIYGKSHFFGFCGKDHDIKVLWHDIKVIGDDTILVDIECPERCQKKKQGFMENLFRQ